MKKSTIYKNLYLVGAMLFFFSLFLEYYSLSVFDSNGELVANWGYYPLFQWISSLEPTGYNDFFRPVGVEIPVALTIVVIGNIIFSFYVILVKNIEEMEFKKGKQYLYPQVSFLVICGAYIFCVPVLFFASKGLFFPYTGIIYGEFTAYYSAGIGYYLQCISFACVFPYALFSYILSTNYTAEDISPEERVNRIIKRNQIELDIDKSLQQERLIAQKHIDLEEIGIEKEVLYK